MGANISVCFLNASTPEFSLSLDDKRFENVVIEKTDSPPPHISKDHVSLKNIFCETEPVMLTNEEDQIDEEQSDSEQSVLAEACVSPSTSSRRK
jgi:hypothetical protein